MLTPSEGQRIFDIAMALRAKLARPIPPYRRPRRSGTLHTVCGHSLFGLVDRAVPAADPVERRAVTVLSYLSPREIDPLPHRLVANRLQIIEAERCRLGKVAKRDQLAEDPDLLVDVVLALALGWWPKGHSVKKVHYSRWPEPWPIALHELIEIATEIVDHGVADLRNKGLAVPAGLLRVRAWAEQAAHDFVLGHRGSSPKGAAKFRYLTFWQPGKCKYGKKPGKRKLLGWLRHALYGDSMP